MLKTSKSIHLQNNNQITLEGNVLHLSGLTLKCGLLFPHTIVKDATLHNMDPIPEGNTLILTVPSVDTPVCDLQLKMLSKTPPLIDNIIVISADTAFAQKRYCNENNVSGNILFYSDAENHDFGKKTGLQILELGLLARSIIVCDKNKVVRYLQVVPELTMLPDIDLALSEIL
ncbi:redoxin family protein [Hafnia paralvei]|uniref:redoxin family protein n=1 Tax=Hafnia paralvei TaxID=546367 RepID=UPI00187D2B03|nr:redoxin family protein [Hafnia paralvei]